MVLYLWYGKSAINVYMLHCSFLHFTSKPTREINKKAEKKKKTHRHVLNVNVCVPYYNFLFSCSGGLTFDTYNRLTVGGF